ncbi:MAG: NAD-dependent epimerase/dehydratase family protein, partial [Geminicoccaceae bacterium]
MTSTASTPSTAILRPQGNKAENFMTTFKNQRIVVVGGAGFVGSNLCHMLLGQDPAKLIVVDNLLSSDPV